MGKKLSIELAKQIALENNGICLSETYSSCQKLLWRCSKDHEWYAKIDSIKNRKSWCRICSDNNKKLNINDAKKIAKQNGGHCLSINYINTATKMIWECSKKHQWNATFMQIRAGRWCPKCAGNFKLNIGDAKKAAQNNGGKLLSKKYINANTKLKWKCRHGHIFSKKLTEIIAGKKIWCPECSCWSSEEICRTFLEKIFNTAFKKVRPKWLLNDRNNCMELDGLSEIMINGKFLAFEHQGEQHFTKNKTNSNYFGDFSLKQRKIDDKVKVKLCNDRNIILIQIPQLMQRTKLKNLASFIKNKCLKNKLDISGYDFEQEINLSSVNSSNYYYNEAQKIIILKNGILLSPNYINTHFYLKIKCNKNHLFKMSLNNLKSGAWCAECVGLKKLTIEDAKLDAKNNNGTCLSLKLDKSKKLKWQCHLGHTWKSYYKNIRNNKTWCPICNNTKKSLISRNKNGSL
jgi:hypothetical protein